MATIDEMFKIIRKLDMDDLIVLSLLLEDCKCSDISRVLRLTPPAISHRINKYINVFGDDFFEKHDQKRVLSPQGIEFAEKAKKVLVILLSLDDTETIKSSLFK